MVPTINFTMNMMEAARINKVSRFLLTSSIGVYSPSNIFYEDDVWQTFPSPNDRFAGWAKRICELQAQAYKIEHGWDKISIARPANVYGPYDNFDKENAMVIPALINRAISGENPLIVWGDGSQTRSFSYVDDTVEGIIALMESDKYDVFNIGNPNEMTIKELSSVILKLTGSKSKLIYKELPNDDPKQRRPDITKAKENLDWEPKVDLETGLTFTIDWIKKELAK